MCYLLPIEMQYTSLIFIFMFRLRELGVDAFRVDPDKMVKGLMPQVRLDVYFPGFPTLKHILHKVNILLSPRKVHFVN